MMSPTNFLPMPGRNPSLYSGAVGKNWLCDLSHPLSSTWLEESSGWREEPPEAGEIQAESAKEEWSSHGSRGLTGLLLLKAENYVFSV